MRISIDKLREENAKALEKSIKEAENHNKIFDAVTGNKVLSAVRVKGVSPHTAAADYALDIICHDENEALTVLENMEIRGGGLLQIQRVKDSCLSFQPEERVKEKHAQITDAGYWVADISRCSQYSTEVKIKAYCHLDEFLIELRLNITHPRIRVDYEYQQTAKGNIIYVRGEAVLVDRKCANWSEFFTNIDRYYSSGLSARFTAYNV